LGRDHDLRSAVLEVFLRVVFRWYEKRAEAAGARPGQTGAVVMAQSFGSSLNCNLHFHALILDGTFAENDNGSVAFHPTRPPSTDEVSQLVEFVHHRIERLLLRRGLLAEEAALADSDDAQLLMQQASLSGRVALGTRAGRRPRALVGPPRKDMPLPKQCASSGWYSLHAGVRIAAQDRPALDRLVRYILRPPLSHDRLSVREDGMLVLRLKTAWRNGTTALLLSGSELLQRLAAIVPRPRSHLLTYHGILGGHARLRKDVVPTPPEDPERGCLHTQRSAPARTEPKGLNRWISWAQLLFRAFGVEAMRCECGACMEVHAIVIGRPATERAMASLSPSLIRSRAPPAVHAAVA
jgi:hypothetical protein